MYANLIYLCCPTQVCFAQIHKSQGGGPTANQLEIFLWKPHKQMHAPESCHEVKFCALTEGMYGYTKSLYSFDIQLGDDLLVMILFEVH